MRNSYNTKQKNLILECLMNCRDKSFTVLEIKDYLQQNGSVVGLTTIYRYLSFLENEGMVKKFIESTIAKYQYIDKNACKCHFHLKCDICGKLIHLECSEINNLNLHIIQKHGFEVDSNKTIIYGVCKECSSK